MALGVTTSANRSSVPTTCTAMVITSASSTRNTTPSARTGTPFAAATCSSSEAKASGRATTAITTATPAVTAVNRTSWRGEMARRLPNRTLVTVLALSEASDANRTPRPVAKASTVPVAISRLLTRSPRNPMASPPARQNTARPKVTGRPSRIAAVAPGKPMWASA